MSDPKCRKANDSKRALIEIRAAEIAELHIMKPWGIALPPGAGDFITDAELTGWLSGWCEGDMPRHSKGELAGWLAFQIAITP